MPTSLSSPQGTRAARCRFPFWGGYLLAPAAIEFWESRPDRLHHRVEYRRSGRSWEERLLQP